MQLVHSEKMAALGQLVAGVSHEVNNSINFITGAIPSAKNIIERLPDQLRQNMSTDNSIMQPETNFDLTESLSDLQLLLDNIKRGADRIVAIGQDLKTFSHKGRDTFEQVDIHQCLDSVLSVVKQQTGEREIKIEKRYDPELQFIYGQQGQITQVFLNITLNAIQAIPDSGHIIVSTQKKEEDISITIVDDGIGIPAANLQQIFEPFFTTKEVGQGTGLGLGICHSIVKNHGGKIIVNSEEGKGTQIEILMPRSGVNT